jgi:hypothetical protein
MIKKIKNLRFDLLNNGNTEKDENLKNEVIWISNQADRMEEIKSIVSFINESAFNYPIIYTNYRRIDFWRELYDEHEDFVKEFKEITSDDSSKLYTKYKNWSEVNKKLPIGSYLSCAIPTSYWYRCGDKAFKKMLQEWDN